MSTTKENLTLLFDRPLEPVFMAKGPKKTVFEVTEEYFNVNPRYKSKAPDVRSRFAEDDEERIVVKKTSIPSLGECLELERDENFSLFIPKHRDIAAKLIDIFMDIPNVDDLLSTAVCVRDCVNPYLFNYALSVAMLHRPDTQDTELPPFITSFPNKFVDSKVFAKAREQAMMNPGSSREPIELPQTASDLEVEHRLAYFREDFGINLHHWHWHLVYPIKATKKIVDKDRRGELFYYMHQQIIARYNYERLCNDLKRTKKLDWTEEIEEAYFPKLDTSANSKSYPARVVNQRIRDLNRKEAKQDVDDLKRWSDQIFAAIHQGSVIDVSKTPKPSQIDNKTFRNVGASSISPKAEV